MWGCSPSDSRFKEMNSAQMHWCALNIQQDKTEDVELYRDLVEYAASFFDSDSVRKIKESRENREKTKVTSKEEDEKFIEDFKNKKYKQFGSIKDPDSNDKTNNNDNNIVSKTMHIRKILGE